MRPGIGRFVVVAAFAVAVCANGWFAGMGHDEGVTVDIAVGQIQPALVTGFDPVPVSDLQACVDGSAQWPVQRVVAELSRRVNPYPPAWFLLMRGWTEFFGVHRMTLRVPSVLCGLATLLGLALLARQLVPRPHAGLWVAVLVALSPWFSAISTFARPYAFVLALGTWTTLIALHLALPIAKRGARPALRVTYVVLSLLGLYSLYHYGFVVAWQVVFLVVATSTRGDRRRSEWSALALMTAVMAAAYVPWTTRLPAHLELTGTMASYYLGPVTEELSFKSLRLLWTFFLGDSLGGEVRYGLVVAFLVLGGFTLMLLVRRAPSSGDAHQDRVARLFFRTGLIYPALILLADLLHGTRTLTITKTSFMLFPILMLLVVRAWSAVPRTGWRSTGLLAWVLLVGASAVATAVTQARMLDHHRVIAATLSADDEPDHYVLLNSMIRGHAIPLLLTLKECGVDNVRVVFAPPPVLDRVLAETFGNPCVRRVTLLNLHSVYAHDVASYCTREQIDAVARRARRGGWRVNRMTPDQRAVQLADAAPERRLDILSPVW